MNTQERRRALLLSAAAATMPASGLMLLPARIARAQSPTPASEAATPVLDVPYVPTPQDVVEQMLKLANVGKSDTVYDLGCGDGRIVVTAARRYGAHGVGIDLNPQRIAEAKANARKAGVARQVSFRVADLFETDLSAATVVSLYLLPDVNRKLRPRLQEQLRPGARVVSHAFDMGPEWPPDDTLQFDGRSLYLWTIRRRDR